MSTSAEKRIGVIGCGLRAMDVFSHIPNLGSKIEIVALYDPRPEAMRAFGEKYAPDAKRCDDWQAVVNCENMDWVFVMSWNCFHKEQVFAAIEAGENIFCEKPIATTPQDCLAIKDMYEKSDSEFVVGFTLRYSPHYRKIKQLIEDGVVGDVVSLEFNETLDVDHGAHIHSCWRRHAKNSGGHLLEKCCHDIDVVNYMIGSPVARVASFGGKSYFLPENAGDEQRLEKNAGGKALWDKQDPERVNPYSGISDVVDNQVAILEYENGVRATFHTNCNAGIPERRLYVLGTKGAIRADVIKGIIETQRSGFDEVLHDESAGVSGGHGGGDDVLGPELSGCIVDGEPVTSTFEDGYTSAMTAFAIEEARTTGTVVDIKKFLKQI